MKSEPIRIEKHLSETGVMSRREAKSLLQSGDLLVNGKSAQSGDKIDPDTDIVTISNQGKQKLSTKETLLVYKPRGVLSSKDSDGTKTVFDTFPMYRHLNCVGRLDKDSEGLLLLSNDGQITKAVTGKHHPIEKEYEVTVREDVLPWMIKKMITGIKLRDGWSKAVAAERIDRHTFRITLREGRKHQIRRVANALKMTVTSLKRIRIDNLHLNDLRPGQARKLTDQDITRIREKALTE